MYRVLILTMLWGINTSSLASEHLVLLEDTTSRMTYLGKDDDGYSKEQTAKVGRSLFFNKTNGQCFERELTLTISDNSDGYTVSVRPLIQELSVDCPIGTLHKAYPERM